MERAGLVRHLQDAQGNGQGDGEGEEEEESEGRRGGGQGGVPAVPRGGAAHRRTQAKLTGLNFSFLFL